MTLDGVIQNEEGMGKSALFERVSRVDAVGVFAT
jgi:hypothetical protein